MKPLVLAVLLAVMQATPPSPLKTSDNPTDTSSHVKSDTGAKQQPTTQSQSLVNPHEPLATKGIAGQQAPKNAEDTVGISKLPPVSVTRDWADWGYWAFGGLLVVVGFFQMWLLRRQANIMTQQAKLSEETLGAIKRQADNMDRQTGILEESVKAANVSAEAAQANVELFINKERSRLRVEVSDFTLQKAEVTVTGAPVALPPLPFQIVSYTVSFYGPTPAFIVDSRAVAKIEELEEPNIDYADTRYASKMFSLPEIIHSSTSQKPLHALLFVDSVQAEKILEGTLFVHFYGFIKYKDIFDRERETTFHLRWQYTYGVVIGNPPAGQWIKCGPKEANRST